MKEDHRKKEEKELVKKFESHLKTGEYHYFDEEDFLAIINFYLEFNKNRHALKACDFALEQFAYSTDLIADKAEILTRLDRLDDAIALIDNALIYAPNDTDLLLQKGSLHTISGEFEASIACFQQALPMAEDRD